jgi:hypothetical protein
MQLRSSLLLALVFALCGGLPSQADGAKSFVANLPKRIVSFTVGAAIGTPIAVVRSTHKELKKQTKVAYDLGGVRPKPLAYASAAFFGIPSGFASGAWTGVFNGVSDSWVNAKEAPFSKGSFSLDKMEF